MKIRTRIILSFALIVGVGFYFLVHHILRELRPRYLEAVEEALVDQANILAALVESQIQDEKIPIAGLRTGLQQAAARRFEARIYRLTKTQVEERIYVTDDKGIVLFDSQGGKEEGRDFSRWRDVYLTLQGSYGARTTRLEPSDPRTSVLHVAAPLRRQGKIVGVLIVSKPTTNINFFLETARPQILIAGGIAAVAVIVLGTLLSLWVTRPIQKLTAYAQAVRDGRPAILPDVGGSEMRVMGEALEEMREALEGKKYVEHYVQSLTHELKSPLAALQGAAELLNEEMPMEDRRRFLANIRKEAERMSQIVDRMLKLASLEARRGLGPTEQVDLASLAGEAVSRLRPTWEKKGLKISIDAMDCPTVGERFLLEEALGNLLQNAIDFSPPQGTIRIAVRATPEGARVAVEDEGPGIPDFAREKIFERFFSLPHPDTGEKSTGLGLSFVREIAALHGGRIRGENRSPCGAAFELTLPPT
jgi:two-component system sensor histidine kinase CreC